MSNFETIEITVRDGQFKKLESWKWDIINWGKLEQTWSYLRRKYGSFKERIKKMDDDDNWVSD